MSNYEQVSYAAHVTKTMYEIIRDAEKEVSAIAFSAGQLYREDVIDADSYTLILKIGRAMLELVLETNTTCASMVERAISEAEKELENL